MSAEEKKDNLEKEAYLDVRTVRDYNGDLIFLVGNEYVIKELKIPSNHLEEDFDGIVTAYVVFEKRKAGTSKEKGLDRYEQVADIAERIDCLACSAYNEGYREAESKYENAIDSLHEEIEELRL